MPNGSTQSRGFGFGTMLAPTIVKQADADKDGKLTEEELVAAVRKLFKEIDKNKKGAIDEKQLAEGINDLFRRQASGRPTSRRGSGFGRNSAFENDLLKDVIPHIEKRYSVLADSDHRAVAGLSMGGGQALGIGLTHLDTFGWVGGFSSALFGRQTGLVPAASARKKLRLLWVSCGDSDSLFDGSKSFHSTLEKESVPHVWHVDSGGHTWGVWKNDLYLLAQKLFREK
jgi:enterochelin esterase-like enzyme